MYKISRPPSQDFFLRPNIRCHVRQVAPPPLGGDTQQIFVRGGSAPRRNPLPFRTPFVYPLWQMVLLSHTLFRTLHPF